MQLKTILNRVQPLPRFVYDSASLLDEGGSLRIEVKLRPRRNGQASCSGCHRRRPGYDRLEERRFVFVPLWGIPVFFLYARRRVDCPRCGVRVEWIPWAEGKQHLTIAYVWFLAAWAQRLSWKQVAEAFHTTWDNVFRSVELAVDWGRKHVNLEGITSIGIDELYWSRVKKKFLTVVYQIDEGRVRLLWVGQDRKAKTLLRFFRWFGPQRTALLRFVCSDMWQPYLKVVAKKAGHALHVLDRFHIMSHMNKAIDKVRAAEVRELLAKGYESILKHSKWLLLKRVENLTEKQDTKLSQLVRYNLKSIRAYLLKLYFEDFWEYTSPYWAGRFLDHWCKMTMRSRLQPMKKVARMLRSHRPLILTWFVVKGLALGAVEGLNNKAKVATRNAYGFRTPRCIEIALYHKLGQLPTPTLTHRFC